MSVFNIPTVRNVAPATDTTAIGMGVPVAPPPAGGTGTTVTEQGVFVTPQTIASFAGATLAVSLMWKVSGIIRPGWESRPLVALVASALVGIVLYFISESDPGRGTVILRDRLIGIFVAFINTLVLFSAAIGAVAATG
jgi:hypothetical protein